MSKVVCLSRRRHCAGSATSKPKRDGSARVLSFSKAPSKIRNFSAGIRPRAFQLETADCPTPHRLATCAVPPSTEITSSIVPSIAPVYSRNVEPSSVHITAMVTDRELWPNFPMISEREFRVSVGKRLKQFRMALGRNQVEFGEKLGVGGTAISNYEKGDRAVDPYDAFKLKMAFGLPLEWLYGGDESVLTPQLLEKLVTDGGRQRRQRRGSTKRKQSAA